MYIDSIEFVVVEMSTPAHLYAAPRNAPIRSMLRPSRRAAIARTSIVPSANQ